MSNCPGYSCRVSRLPACSTCSSSPSRVIRWCNSRSSCPVSIIAATSRLNASICSRETIIKGGCLVSAPGFEVARLAAVGTLDPVHCIHMLAKVLGYAKKEMPPLLTVARLWAVSCAVTKLVTVPALDFGHILWLWTLIRPVAFAVTVSANDLSGLRAISRRVAFLSTVEASTWTTTLGAITREVTD